MSSISSHLPVMHIVCASQQCLMASYCRKSTQYVPQRQHVPSSNGYYRRSPGIPDPSRKTRPSVQQLRSNPDGDVHESLYLLQYIPGFCRVLHAMENPSCGDRTVQQFVVSLSRKR